MKKYTEGFNLEDGTLKFIPPLATETQIGGIIASPRKNESVEVVIDTATGKAYTERIPVPRVTQKTDGLMSFEDKTKLDGLPDKWEGIDFIDASKVIQDDTHRFVTASRIDYWDRKASTDTATIEKDGLMSAADKDRLDRMSTGAEILELDANKIVENENRRFVTDEQIAKWSASADTTLATQTKHGLMSAEDKYKLDKIEEKANNYIHPETHSVDMIVTTVDKMFVSDKQVATWDAKASKTTATTVNNGLMSAVDKLKLNSIEQDANNYIHPSTHPASMITEDDDHRFVTVEQLRKLEQLEALIDEKLNILRSELKTYRY